MKKSLLVSTFVALAAVAFPASALSFGSGYAGAAGRAYSGASLDFGVSLDIGFCYNYLAPYGSWVSMEPYGYVWCPRHVAYGWRPYSEGHWVWTDYGWTWISDEDWGWIPFHYGRWDWDDDIGWFWVPGTTWGPAWVTWRYNDEYCGWAPLPPGAGFQAGVGFRSLSVNVPGRFWVFVQASHFLDHDVRSRVLPYERNMTIINNTTLRNNIYVRNDRIINEGIGLDDARRWTRRDVPRYALRDVSQPGRASISGREVRIYRPVFQENPSARPSVILNRNNARSESAPPNVSERRQQPKSLQPKVDMKKRQAEEKRMVQQTQSRELKQMQRKQSEEMKRAQNAAAKAQVKQQYQSRMSELQKSHKAEQQQMAERHRRETEQFKAGNPAKQGRAPAQARQRQPEERAGNSRPPGR